MITGMIIGFLVGGFFGILVMCMMNVASSADYRIEKILQGGKGDEPG